MTPHTKDFEVKIFVRKKQLNLKHHYKKFHVKFFSLLT